MKDFNEGALSIFDVEAIDGAPESVAFVAGLCRQAPATLHVVLSSRRDTTDIAPYFVEEDEARRRHARRGSSVPEVTPDRPTWTWPRSGS